MRSLKTSIQVLAVSLFTAMVSCVDTETFERGIDNLEERIAALESVVSLVNANSVAVSALYADGIAILDVSPVEDGYVMELSDGTVIRIVDGINAAQPTPVIGLDGDGRWIVSTDGGETFEPIEGASGAMPDCGVTPVVRVNVQGYWECSVDGGMTWTVITGKDGRPFSAVDGREMAGKTSFFTEIVYSEGDDSVRFTLADGRTFSVPVEDGFVFEVTGHEDRRVICLSETVTYAVRSADVSDLALTVPEGWSARCTEEGISVTAPAAGKAGEYEVNVIAVSSRGWLRNVSLVFTLNPVTLDPASCPEWNNFIAGNSRNVLPDFSYAGYSHGEAAPPSAESLGYRKFDVTDYGAVPDDGKSDREAFLAVLKAVSGNYTTGPDGTVTFPSRESADAIIYFPEGEFILHTEDDDAEGRSASIIIRSGNFILKGAGMDKTTLVMQDPMLPQDEDVLYSSQDMLQIKHNSGISSFKVPAVVTEDAPKGGYAVTVSSAVSLHAGDWVCLHMKNADPGLVASEVAPYQAESHWTISTDGVEVIDYHQVKSVNGNVVTFIEPLMHAVEAKWGWEIKEYPHYENVGVEDLRFKGNAKADFEHHGSWQDDGAFKPLSLNRLVNSWIRNVAFDSVSEACSIINSANVSAYNIVMTGNRGHSSVRSQASSRVLIAATSDETAGGAGNFHGVGVSRNSIGTVLWRNTWGDDSCFEAHSTQPRATLVDCCTGGWMRGHQGGDAVQAPNHLDDLVIWNFSASGAGSAGTSDYADFLWWESTWWKFLPPVIVGFRSDVEVAFNAGQTKVISSPGVHVGPESLYEAQLKHRLGAVPAWLEMLK